MSINCWLSKTEHDNPFADNLFSSEMIAINQGYRYLGMKLRRSMFSRV
jgi:hypothetical protein